MSKPDQPARNHPHTEEEIRAYTVGEVVPLSVGIAIVDYDPRWPEQFTQEAGKIQAALGPRATRIEHIGSTSVPKLAAKPVLDILLVVKNSTDEKEYVPALENDGYVLRVREPDWYEHRMLKRMHPEVNLHVFSAGCPEIDRVLLFRDWLRNNAADRDLYARTKKALAQQRWKHMQNYADAKTEVVEEILKHAIAVQRANPRKL